MLKSILTAIAAVFFINAAVCQTIQNFEGESTANVFKNIKVKYNQTGGGLMMKMIMKPLMKRFIGNNPDANYNGSYTIRTVSKDGKTKVEASYNNSVTIDIPVEDGQIKEIVYYPYIKKGYYFFRDVTAVEDKQKLEDMRKGEIQNTGETMTILGYTCNVYKVKYHGTTDTLGTTTEMDLSNEYAICTDPSLPGVDEEVLPGVKGCPLKFTTNNTSMSTNEGAGFNMDTRYSISQIMTSIKARKVDDSEFEVPADIKIYAASKIMKTVYENKEYMEKHGLWNELPPDSDKIYDNLADDWDF